MSELEPDASELQFGDDFNKAECLSNAEVAILLKEKQEQMQKENEEQIPNEVFEKTVAYVSRFGKYKNKETVKEIRKTLEKRDLHQYEVAQIANLNPANPDEAKELIPSLRRFDDDSVIQDMLDDVENFRKDST